MTVTVEAYGKLLEIIPQPLRLDLPPGRVRDVIAALAEQFPGAAEDWPRVAVARGADILPRDAAIDPGDVLALIPPVGGG